MPIYQYDCPNHQVFEEILPLARAEDPSMACPKCGATSPRITSLTTMRPDSSWHFGEFVKNHGYLNSSSRIARAKKANGTVTLGSRSDIEGMKKEASKARKSWDDDLAKKSQKVFRESFQGSGVIDSDGGVRPEATVPITAENISKIDS